MTDNIPPMPTGQEPARPADQQPHRTAAPEWQPQYAVPPEQRLVYESTPPVFPPAAEQSEWTQPSVRPRKSRRSPWLFASIGGAIGLALGLVIGLVAVPAIGTGIMSQAEALAPSPFVVALDTCDLSDSAYATIGDDGASLELQSEGDEAVGMSADEFVCVIEALDVSDAVISRLETTRALDGRQEASWGNFSASWTYHPDNGVNMLIERAPNDES